MRNIHLLPTDNPSKLFEILQFNYVFDNQNKYSEEYKKIHKYKNKHIYITSDEQIKEEDWVLYDKKYIRKTDKTFNKQGMDWNVLNTDKIILTTDEDLIKDGVRTIDGEFLKWFVQNPSCEHVEVLSTPAFPMYETWIEHVNTPPFYGNLKYKIVIPEQQTNGEAAEKMYTESEVKDMLLEVMNLGMKVRQDQLSGHTDKSGNNFLWEWFEQNKKK